MWAVSGVAARRAAGLVDIALHTPPPQMRGWFRGRGGECLHVEAPVFGLLV